MLRVSCLLSLLSLAACGLYPQWNGEFSAGPADPTNYPPPYLGTNGDRSKPANGSFTQIKAQSAGATVGYFAFPFAPTVLPPPVKNPPDPLLLSANGVAATAIPTPQVFVFDPTPGVSAFPNTPKCLAPSHYTYDMRTDEVNYTDQGNIFTALPAATYSVTKSATWSYEPIVSETAISSQGEACQSLKSQGTVTKSLSASATADGRFLAWPIIDTGAAVYRIGETLSGGATGISFQHWGWYNHYLVAYLDGGYIPTDSTPAADGTPQVRMVTQKLYYPTAITTASPTPAAACTASNGGCATTAKCDATSGTTLCSATGAVSTGYDVIAAARGDTGYSPVCQVFTYTPVTGTLATALPTDMATIEDTTGPLAKTIKAASTPYIYCLQVQ